MSNALKFRIMLFFSSVALRANRRNRWGWTARRFASSLQSDALCESRDPPSDTRRLSRSTTSAWAPTLTWSQRRMQRGVRSRREGKPARRQTIRPCTSTDRTRRLKTRCSSSWSTMKTSDFNHHQFVLDEKLKCSAFVTVNMTGQGKVKCACILWCFQILNFLQEFFYL